MSLFDLVDCSFCLCLCLLHNLNCVEILNRKWSLPVFGGAGTSRKMSTTIIITGHGPC